LEMADVSSADSRQHCGDRYGEGVVASPGPRTWRGL